MWDILNSPLWQVVGVLVTVVGIVIALIIYLLQRNRKALSYKIISSSPLVKTSFVQKDIDLKGRLEILFMGKSVKDVHLVLIKIFNSGNVPIKPEDYEQPISIKFGEKTQILSAIVSNRTPNNINIATNVEKNNVILNKVLLNKSDSIEFTILVSDYDNEITIDGRIASIKEIKLTDEKFTLIKYPFILGIGIFLATAVMLPILISSGYATEHNTELLSWMMPFLMLAVFLIVIPMMYLEMKK